MVGREILLLGEPVMMVIVRMVIIMKVVIVVMVIMETGDGSR
jgi:hypothetical protein